MQRPINDRSRDTRFNPLLHAECLVLGVLLLVMTAAFGLNALLF